MSEDLHIESHGCGSIQGLSRGSEHFLAVSSIARVLGNLDNEYTPVSWQRAPETQADSRWLLRQDGIIFEQTADEEIAAIAESRLARIGAMTAIAADIRFGDENVTIGAFSNLAGNGIRAGKHFRVGEHTVIRGDFEVGDNFRAGDIFKAGPHFRAGNNFRASDFVRTQSDFAAGDNVRIKRALHTIAAGTTIQSGTKISR